MLLLRLCDVRSVPAKPDTAKCRCRPSTWCSAAISRWRAVLLRCNTKRANVSGRVQLWRGHWHDKLFFQWLLQLTAQPAGSTQCSAVVLNSGATSNGMACACINTNNSPGLASPVGYATCSDACYESSYGRGASIPGSGSDTKDPSACIASDNVGVSNAFGNVVQDPSTGVSSCLTASLTGGPATQSSSYSCACVFPTPSRRRLTLHRKDLTALAAEA